MKTDLQKKLDNLSRDLRSQSSAISQKQNLVELLKALPDEAPDTLCLMYQTGPGGNLEHIFGRMKHNLPPEARDALKKAADNAFHQIKELLIKRLDEL